MTRSLPLATTAVWALLATTAFAQAPAAGDASLRVAQLGVDERVCSENWDDIVGHDAAKGDMRHQHQWRLRTRLTRGAVYEPASATCQRADPEARSVRAAGPRAQA